MYKVMIEKATEDDAADIIDYLNLVGGESDNLLFGKDEFHVTVEQEKEHIRNMDNSFVMFLGKINNNIAAVGTLRGFTRDRIAHRGEIAISVKKEYWNNGIGTEMMKKLIEFGKDEAGLSVIQLTVKADNEKAIHLYNKLGFKQIGFYEKFFNINGKYYDAYLMNLYF
jgi:RimJ/RimL family protein N-acetyltransferase